MAGITKWIDASPNELVYDVAERSIQTHLDTVHHFLPLAVQQPDDDIEYVHQIRVWSRRATSALRLYRDLLPWGKAARVKKHLSKIRRAANDARDDDVLILRLQQDVDDRGAARLLERVLKHRQQSQQPLLEMFERLDQGVKLSRRVNRLLKSTRQRAKTDKHGTTKFRKWARKNLRPYVEEFFHRAKADLSDCEELHQLRISGKKLRYTMELLAGAFPERFTRQLAPKVKALQDRLGEINDYATAKSRYERWIDESKKTSEADYLKGLMDEEQVLLEQRRAEFFEWFTPGRAQRLARAFDSIMVGRPVKRQRRAADMPDNSG
ncbi:MAG: CHAD domain-containing protein [Pirellulaceae bacterium]